MDDARSWLAPGVISRVCVPRADAVEIRNRLPPKAVANLLLVDLAIACPNCLHYKPLIYKLLMIHRHNSHWS